MGEQTMTDISNNTCGRKFGRTHSFILGLLALVAALTLADGTPCMADAVYSGTSVGGNGTAYGWGVTDARSMSSHTTHTSSTLTSPHGRQASNSACCGSYTRVDLQLSFDPDDMGSFQEDDWHWAFCPVLGRWFWNGVHTSSSGTVCSYAIQGQPQDVNCTGNVKNETHYVAAQIPATCSVYPPTSDLTFVVSGDVTADTEDSYQSFVVQPELFAFYWAGPGGGSITPQFTIRFTNGQSVFRQKTDPVCQ
jgi:hypothetical protein